MAKDEKKVQRVNVYQRNPIIKDGKATDEHRLLLQDAVIPEGMKVSVVADLVMHGDCKFQKVD